MNFKRITQSQAAQLLHISERQIRRLLQKYKAQNPAALAHAVIPPKKNAKPWKDSSNSSIERNELLKF